ncbi:hypothetical protein L1887_03446 [Cichorium endivia]|nr:hypothetical protein L1887_03446 [Cichorium endivia]
MTFQLDHVLFKLHPSSSHSGYTVFKRPPLVWIYGHSSSPTVLLILSKEFPDEIIHDILSNNTPIKSSTKRS